MNDQATTTAATHNVPDDFAQRSSEYYRMAESETLALDCGATLSGVQVAYQTYGTLNADKSNAIMICHALTGDQHVANIHPATGKPGWWELMVGPGLPLDTDRFFVICPNVLGGCMGTTGPKEIDPATGAPYGTTFPLITIADMVRLQKRLVDHLGISQLFCVIGGSMGGMLVLQWAASYPESVYSAVPIATAAKHTAQNIALHEVGRQAIMGDPGWHNGDYYRHNTAPVAGLSVARMVAHITYLSELSLHAKFGRRLQDRDALSFGFGADFQVESYLRHQGSTFVERFDANSYLYITRAMDYFDLPRDYDGVLANAFRDCAAKWCIVSFTSDWLYPTAENRLIVKALNTIGADVSFVEIEADGGHDSFLLDEPEMFSTLRGFVDASARKRGLSAP